MNELVRRCALYTRDLLNHDHSLIIPGRENFDRKDFTTPYIVVDALGAQLSQYAGQTYDGVAEKLHHRLGRTAAVTWSFYGDEAGSESDPEGADARCDRFALLSNGPNGRRLARALAITVMRPGNKTDIRALTGSQYGARIDLEATVWIEASAVEDVRRIDTLTIETTGEET